MSDKIAVVYIGPKAKKRDTVTGSRLIFPRHEAVEVDSAIAHQLLDFPTVFIREAALQDYLAQEAVTEQKQAAYETFLANQEEMTSLSNSFALNIGDAVVDIAKLTSIQLATLVESEDLNIKQDAQEKVDDFRVRIRDAIQARNAASEAESDVELNAKAE
ncbi:hypothetical protein [Yersinia bercovieri]|uniref:hypothetical protein n=1 Tax=Yersinia bercovieri TaxID=634 RepID=UPI0011A125EA|nr:hypothetical protein [Yersinia bercovieri]